MESYFDRALSAAFPNQEKCNCREAFREDCEGHQVGIVRMSAFTEEGYRSGAMGCSAAQIKAREELAQKYLSLRLQAGPDMTEGLHDHLQESKGPTIRCPVCHYMAERENVDLDVVEGALHLVAWHCRSAADHLFYLVEETG